MVQAERRRGRRRSHEHKVFTGRPELESRTGAIDAIGAYTGQTLYIAAALKDGVLHKAMWLHVLSSDSQLLLHRLPSAASTCIVRNEHVRKETDEHCARRAIREELCRKQAWYGPSAAQLADGPRLAGARGSLEE